MNTATELRITWFLVIMAGLLIGASYWYRVAVTDEHYGISPRSIGATTVSAANSAE